MTALLSLEPQHAIRRRKGPAFPCYSPAAAFFPLTAPKYPMPETPLLALPYHRPTALCFLCTTALTPPGWCGDGRRNEFKNKEKQPSEELLGWLAQQDTYVRDGIARWATNRGVTDEASAAMGSAGREQGQARGGREDGDYWRRLGLVMQQFDGLCEGVWRAAQPGQNLTYWELYVLQSMGDLYDLTVLFPQHEKVRTAEQQRSSHAKSQREYRPGHGVVGPEGYGGGELLECSALIKLATAPPGSTHPRSRRSLKAAPALAHSSLSLPNHDLAPEKTPELQVREFWAGHTTWRPFYAMLRTWKVYDLPWSKSGPLSVSSSPGFVGYSKDDW